MQCAPLAVWVEAAVATGWKGSFHLDQLVLPAADAQLRRGLHGVDAVERLDALDQVGLAGILRGVHQVQARLVQGHRVQRGQEATAQQSQSTDMFFITLR